MTQTPTHPTHPTRPSRPSRPTLASPSSPSSHPIRPPRVDALQYCAWSEEVFRENLRGGLSAVHATVCYHENFRESAANIGEWREMFRAHSDLIFPGRKAGDILRAQETGRLAVFFGAQNPSAMDGDISLVAALRDLGVSFMQLTYNNQSLLGGGCMEARDSGLTRMGREVLAEMNRVGTRRGLVARGGADLHGGDCVFGASGCDYARAFGGVAFVAARGFVGGFACAGGVGGDVRVEFVSASFARRFGVRVGVVLRNGGEGAGCNWSRACWNWVGLVQGASGLGGAVDARREVDFEAERREVSEAARMV